MIDIACFLHKTKVLRYVSDAGCFGGNAWVQTKMLTVRSLFFYNDDGNGFSWTAGKLIWIVRRQDDTCTVTTAVIPCSIPGDTVQQTRRCAS
jgi:hypothetical protein